MFTQNRSVFFRNNLLSSCNNEISLGNFLENDFWTPPPPIYFVHDHFFNNFTLNVRHVGAALGPLVCPSRSARPRKCLNLT